MRPEEKQKLNKHYEHVMVHNFERFPLVFPPTHTHTRTLFGRRQNPRREFRHLVRVLCLPRVGGWQGGPVSMPPTFRPGDVRCVTVVYQQCVRSSSVSVWFRPLWLLLRGERGCDVIRLWNRTFPLCWGWWICFIQQGGGNGSLEEQ